MSESVEDLLAMLQDEVNESIATLSWAQFGLQKAVRDIVAEPVNPAIPTRG